MLTRSIEMHEYGVAEPRTYVDYETDITSCYSSFVAGEALPHLFTAASSVV